MAEHLRKLVAQDEFPPVGHITASFGIAALSGSDSAETLVKRADNALYQSKNEGRNRCTSLEGPKLALIAKPSR